MAWYYGKFSCGHEGRVNIIGPHKDRPRKIELAFSKLCPECYQEEMKKEREIRMKEAIRKTEEYDLPQLTGSEKQIAWAIQLRINFIEYVDELKKREGPNEIPVSEPDKKLKCVTEIELDEAIDYGIMHHVDAKFWINNRSSLYSVVVTLYKEFQKKKIEDQIQEDVKKELITEKERLTVSPEQIQKTGIVVIKKHGNKLMAEYVKDDLFRVIVKELKFSWNGENWFRNITECEGNIEDRAAELGHKLLTSGFTVRFFDEKSKEKAISNTFDTEHKRWVKYNYEQNKLAIAWAWSERSDSLYQTAKKLPGAKWYCGTFLVSVEFYREVFDFASSMNFKFTKRAIDEIEIFKNKEKVFQKENISQ